MRRILIVAFVAAFAVAFYIGYRDRGSDEVKAQMLALVGDMDLTDEWHAETRSLVELFHEQSFNAAFDVSKRTSRRFDEKLYQQELFDAIIEDLNSAGKNELAEALSEQRHLHSLVVTER